MSDYEDSKRARQDLVRVLQQHQERQGKLPNLRESEKKAHERADYQDKKQRENKK